MPMPPPIASPEAIALRDIPPLPIFAYVPSLAVWLGAAIVLGVFGWLKLRGTRRRSGSLGDSLALVEAEIDRCLAHGAPREAVFSVSRAVKVLLRTRDRGDFTAETPGELRRLAEVGARAEVRRTLLILAELDESKYSPDRAVVEGGLRELRTILRPLVEPHPPAGDAGHGGAV